MKLGRFIVLLIVALATATDTGLAQQPEPEKGVSRAGVVGDANRLAVVKEPLNTPLSARQPVRKTTSPSATTTVGFLPADLFAPTTEPKAAATAYPISTRELTASMVVDRSNEKDSPAALAKKLQNPVSALARASFLSSLDYALAADREGWRYTMNFEPVLPIALNKNWNLISRTTLPFIQQDGVVASSVQTGLGDIIQSVLLSPSKTEPFFWGAGAAVLIPTATDTRLGTGKFGLGPTVAVGKHQGGWTYGALARHLWSVAGHRDRADVRATYLQPFVAYTTQTAWTYRLDTEAVYDWVGKQWSVPIHLEVTKVVRFGRQPVSVGGALRCWAATYPGGPQACGFRFVVTPLFPAR